MGLTKSSVQLAGCLNATVGMNEGCKVRSVLNERKEILLCFIYTVLEWKWDKKTQGNTNKGAASRLKW